jgi:acyl-CoA synthetase (NDP forming)
MIGEGDAQQRESASTLSEFASKELLRGYGIPFAREENVADAGEAAVAASKIGLPVALKLCGDHIAHKTERDLVRLDLSSPQAVEAAASELLAKATPEDGEVSLLVAEMLSGRRELIAGLVRDPQFGPCILLGLGGILAEVQADVVFAAAPISREEARGMIHGLSASEFLTRPFRGEPPVDVD